MEGRTKKGLWTSGLSLVETAEEALERDRRRTIALASYDYSTAEK